MAYFDTHAKKVNKIDAPLLVIGLGGTGADGLLRIKSEFAQRLISAVTPGGQPLNKPPRTAYLEIDTDDFVKQKRYHGARIDDKEEWVGLSCDIRYVLGDNGNNLEPCIKKWLDRRFYTDQGLIDHAATDGAGTYRQLSRLMLFRNVTDIVSKLQNVMKTLSTISPGAPLGKREINVIVVTGLSGGTGSGVFLDLAYLIRYAAEQSNYDVKVNLYAVAPDVTIDRQAVSDPVKADIYKTNSFAALKELDYWMAYNDRRDPDTEGEYKVDYGNNILVKWNHVPFDDVTLLCAMNEQGALLENAYNVVMNSMAEVLLFQMADETEEKDRVGQNNDSSDDSFTFQSQHSNEHAYRQQIAKPFAENYCYRTIGAYSNLGEQRSKVSIEADMIFSDVEKFSLAPEQLPVMDGKDPAAFCAPFDEMIGIMYQDFLNATRYNTEMFTGQPPYSLKEVKAMSAENTPHGLHAEWYRGLKTQLPTIRTDFSARARKRLNQSIKEYTLEHGVDALEIMLSDPSNGFLKWLNDKVNSYRSQKESYHTAVLSSQSEAYSKHSQMISMGNGISGAIDWIAKLPQTFEIYKSQTESMYENTQSEEAISLLADVLEELSASIKIDILGKTIPYAQAALKQIREQVADDVKNIATTSGSLHLIDLDKMREDIRKQYEAEEHQTQFRRAVLECVIDVIISATEVSDQDSAADYVIATMNSLIDNVFNSINDMTLASMLVGFADINAEGVADHVRENICPQMERGASPHFALASSYGKLNPNNAVICSYISVPVGADEVKAGIKSYISQNKYSGAVIKNSQISDRIFWMNIVAGLPLCAYAYLAKYERVYLQKRGDRPGTHLVMVNQKDLDRLGETRSVLNDWNLLPSPNPFKTLGDTPIEKEIIIDWEKTEDLLNKAEEAGVLHIDTSSELMAQYRADLHFFCDRNGQRTEEKTIQDRLNLLLNQEESDEKKEQNLRELLNERIAFSQVGTPSDTEKQAIRFAMASGEQGLFDHNREIKAKNFREVIYYRLSKRPVLLIEIRRQIAIQSPIRKELREIEERIRQKQDEASRLQEEELKAIRAVDMVAKLLVYGHVQLLLNGISYMDDVGNFKSETGTVNVLMNQNNTPYKGKTWANFIPLEARLAIWYGQQDETEEPVASLNARADELTDTLMNLTGTPEDLEMVHEYCRRAEGIISVFPKKLAALKLQSKVIPKETLEFAVKIMNQLKTSIEAIIAPWQGL